MPLTDGASVSVAAGATSNIFAGRPIEFLGAPSTVTLLLTADAALLTSQVLINIGGNQMAPLAAGTPVNVASAAGAGPKNDEDVVCTFAVPAGARLQCNITNPTGGAIISRYRALIT
jgi:hypothetical protein